jgi:hypothetical protein
VYTANESANGLAEWIRQWPLSKWTSLGAGVKGDQYFAAVRPPTYACTFWREFCGAISRFSLQQNSRKFLLRFFLLWEGRA